MNGWLCAVLVGLESLSTTVARADPPRSKMCIEEYVGGQRLRQSHKLLEARESLSTCARSPCKGFIVSDCARWLEEVQARIPAVVLVALDATGYPRSDVRVTMDGVLFCESIEGESKDVDPGLHSFVFDAATGGKAELTVLVPEGDKALRVVVHLPTPLAPVRVSRARPWMLTMGQGLAAAGLAWLGLGVAFGIEAAIQKGDAKCDARSVCPQQGTSAEWTAYYAGIRSTTAMVIGGLLSAAGIGLWVASPSLSASAPVGGRAAGLNFVWTW
jgi:hypothetical protein